MDPITIIEITFQTFLFILFKFQHSFLLKEIGKIETTL